MIEIAARRGKATRLSAGQSVKIVNTYGQQVVDTWAFRVADIGEFMSMEHTRIAIGRIIPKLGDALVTNRRRPILRLVEIPPAASMTRWSRPATAGATSCSAARATTTIAPTIWRRRWASSASRRPRRRRRSICS